MVILFIGDIVGNPGRQAIKRWLPELRTSHAVDVTVANGENAAGGLGATRATLREIFDAGVQIVTLGNHTWRRKEIVGELDQLEHVVRPANYPAVTPGKGTVLVALPDGRKVGVINLVGRVFMEPLDCPFAAAERELKQLRESCRVILVDMHAEATSEKMAMGYFLDGRCSAVIGTHTHVQTADERILPHGTAYITDAGMTGPFDSVIGVEPDRVIHRFRTGMPVEFKVARGRPGLNGVVVTVDEESGLATSIERIARWD